MTRQITILFADDDRVLQRVHIRILSEAGYTVHTAKTAASAIEDLDTGCIDLLILDVMMPTGDINQSPLKGLRAGIAVAEHVRKTLNSKMPIIYQTIIKDQTVHSVIQLIEKEAGLKPNILVKPVYTDELLAAVQLCLAGTI